MLAGLIDGPGEIALLALIVLVLFGGSQIPKMARNLARAQHEFKRGIDDEHDERVHDQRS